MVLSWLEYGTQEDKVHRQRSSHLSIVIHVISRVFFGIIVDFVSKFNEKYTADYMDDDRKVWRTLNSTKSYMKNVPSETFKPTKEYITDPSLVREVNI